MDNLNSPVSTVFEAFELYVKSKSRMKDAGFNLKRISKVQATDESS